MRASFFAALTIFFLLASPPSSHAQQKRRSITKPTATNNRPKVAEPSLPELLKSLKEFVLSSAHYKNDTSTYSVSAIDFDDCKFLFEIKLDSISYDGTPTSGVSRYTSDFRYFTEQIAVYKEGLGKPTLVTAKTTEDRKLVLYEHSYQSGTYRNSTTETKALLQLAFEEKESGQKVADMLTQIIKLCKAQ